MTDIWTPRPAWTPDDHLIRLSGPDEVARRKLAEDLEAEVFESLKALGDPDGNAPINLVTAWCALRSEVRVARAEYEGTLARVEAHRQWTNEVMHGRSNDDD